MPKKETDARIIIDDLLRQAFWDPTDNGQVRTEEIVPGGGRADYLLLSRDGKPLAVVEAKKTAIHPYTAKQQALPYAKKLGAPFIFLTNGDLIYFWDYLNDDARAVNAFYSRRDMERLLHLRKESVPLATVPIPDFYSRKGEVRQLRPYQIRAMKALDHALELGKRRFLIELPTGTGKTDLICLYLQRLIQANRAERILFLVDRDQLAKQALEAINGILPTHGSYWLKPGVARSEEQITVCLLQTMIGRYQEFSSGYFDVVVADECHRSIYGAWQTALTHFDALHIGLTATPAMFIERNTFKFYDCKDDEPDFTYDIRDAIKEQYLAPYKFATGITVILAEGADLDEEHYDPVEFERKWTNEDTNRKMMAEFDRLAWENTKELAPGQKTAPGKAIVFAITKHHAARLAEYLNDLHPECKGDYAQVITSDISHADDLIRRFKYEAYPQVAVSVDMLTTGFDCREVLHLALCRRIRSPILYQQVRGRGTRTAPHIGKRCFVIYDFFRNHEHFNDSDTDIFTGTGKGRAPGGGGTAPQPPRGLIDLGLEDEWLDALHYVEVGPEGERVDKRHYVSKWEQAIQEAVHADPILQKVRDDENLTAAEEEALAEKLNQPRWYFNEENLRRAYRKPLGSIVDFIKAALGKLKIKSHEEEVNENFHAWLVSRNFTPQQAQYLVLLKNRGAALGRIGLTELFQPPLSVLDAAALGVELFGELGLKRVVEDLNESVFLHRTGT